jgi:NodT family efflux transporter outer membrane factor (OMF) lipoprotein
MPRIPLVLLCLVNTLAGCTMLGPDFVRPQAPEESSWLNEGAIITNRPPVPVEWWKVFNDPVLDRLIQAASAQNLDLQVAGLRIMEARAQLGIAVGLQYPQLQQANGSATRVSLSENAPNFNPSLEDNFTSYQAGFDASWEVDFWGRFRRGIQAADANLEGSVADYDNAMVSLLAEVARTYIRIRTLEERLEIAHKNIEIQKESLRIAEVRSRHGATTELDVQQARSALANTEALVPATQGALRQAKNGLSILLGMPPGDLGGMLAGPGKIPVAPAEVAAGIPADLLRRRPDVRKAELLAAGQSALIGVAESNLYPRFSLLGSIGFQSSDTFDSSAGDLFDSNSLYYAVGPSFSWNILNYGRLTNNVRVQDARYQQAIVNYRSTVLAAYRETEDAMAGIIQAREESTYRQTAALAAGRATDMANIQYRKGSVDFQRVLDSERALVQQEELWLLARGDIALNLIAIYKSLGGGWEIREGHDFVSAENRRAMQRRTNWGTMLDTGSTANADPSAATAE